MSKDLLIRRNSMKKSQLKIIRDKLIKTGIVSRNWCLKRYISRLSARIADLKNAGYLITGSNKKTKNGLDYVYKLVEVQDEI
jgi:hypothetical protein